MAGGIAIVVAIVSIPRHLTPTPNSIRNPNSMCNKSKDRMLLQLEDLLLTTLLQVFRNEILQSADDHF